MQHYHLCVNLDIIGPICVTCATIENVREDEHYRIIDGLELLPPNTTLAQVIEHITP